MIRAGLIGAHIARTRLPAALRLLGEMTGIEVDFTLIDTGDRRDVDLALRIRDCRAAGWTGLSVTHPWKTEAARLAGDGMTAEAGTLGAANLLLFGDAGITGHNTDYTGFLGAWNAAMSAPPGRVAMAGAGGVARAIGPALARLGAVDIAIWDPAPGRADDLARRIGAPARAVAPDAAGAAIRAATGLVNATALGMGDDPRSAVDPADLGPQSWAFDAVYTPVATPFLRAAGQAGLTVLSGFDLFRHMALDTFRIYAKTQPDPATALARLEGVRPDA